MCKWHAVGALLALGAGMRTRCRLLRSLLLLPPLFAVAVGCSADLGGGGAASDDLLLEVTVTGDQIETVTIAGRYPAGSPELDAIIRPGDGGDAHVAILDDATGAMLIDGDIPDPRLVAPEEVDEGDTGAVVDFLPETTFQIAIPAPSEDLARVTFTLRRADGSAVTSEVMLDSLNDDLASSSASLATSSPLQPGMCKPAVERLERALVALHYPVGRIDQCYREATRHAVMAFQKANGLTRDGVAGPETLRALSAPRKPRARYASGTHVEVDRGKQLLYLVRQGAITRIFNVTSGGPGYTTPAGTFNVFRKEEQSWSVPYSVWLPWASYFNNGIATHQEVLPGSPVGPYPASHGCVRTPTPFAERIYNAMPMGTRVYVY